MPRRRAADSTHAGSSPNGHPRATLRRNADNSFSLNATLTRFPQLGNLAMGQGESSFGSGSGGCSQRQSEPQRHCSADATNPARRA